MPPIDAKPRVFVGSSLEGHMVALTIQKHLSLTCEAEVWSQGTFELSKFPLESLLSSSPAFDFAVLVLSADDVTIARGTERRAVRDNVLFELGLFFGVLGRNRTFVVLDRRNPPVLPSDLVGLTAAQFEMGTGSLEAALGPACTDIQLAIQREGRRVGAGQRVAGPLPEVTPLQAATADMGAQGLMTSACLHVMGKLLSGRGVPLKPEELVQLKADFEALTRLLG